MGRLGGPWGVRGWIHVIEYTDEPGSLLRYSSWFLKRRGQWQKTAIEDGKPHGKGLVVKLHEVDDRETAALFTGTEIGIYREQLPEPEENEFYWSDLVGMQVITADGKALGQVDHLIETGSNDVLVVKGEKETLVPWIPDQVIESVDPEAGEIRVNWDPDF